MESMISELVRKNRSYRGYDESFRFTKNDLEEYVDTIRLCASTSNIQPFKYYIIYEKEELDKIQNSTVWAVKLPDVKLPHEGKRPTGFIVICQDDEVNGNLNMFLRDAGIVAQTIALMATEKNLGACILGGFNAKKVRDALELDEFLHPLLIVALGKPDETVKMVEAAPGSDTTYYRDEQDIHYVPKRSLQEVLIN